MHYAVNWRGTDRVAAARVMVTDVVQTSIQNAREEYAQ